MSSDVVRGLRLQRAQQAQLLALALEAVRSDLVLAMDTDDFSPSATVQQLQQVVGAAGRGIAAAARLAAIDEALALTEEGQG